MGKNVAQKLIEAHLVDGIIQPGKEIGIKIDQTLTQDATGTMVMLEFEAMQILVQPTGKRGEPSSSYGTVRCPGKDVTRLG